MDITHINSEVEAADNAYVISLNYSQCFTLQGLLDANSINCQM